MKFEPNGATPAEPVLPALEPEVWEVPEAPLLAEIDPELVVEEAELLLREAAPHDFDVLVIGGGPGGLAAALDAARGGLHVALVEKSALGGLDVGGGGLAVKMRRNAIQSGRDGREMQDFQQQMAELRIQQQRDLEAAGVAVILGRARFVQEHTLEIEHQGTARRVTAVHIVLAVGGYADPSKSRARIRRAL